MIVRRMVVTATAACLALAACGDEEPASAPTATAVTATAPPTSTPKQAVLDAYEQQWIDFGRAGKAREPNPPYLSQTRTGPALRAVRSTVAQFRRRGQVLSGTYETHPRVTKLGVRNATLDDCGRDRFVLRSVKTGKLVGSGKGAKRHRIVELVLEGQRWKVKELLESPDACSSRRFAR